MSSESHEVIIKEKSFCPWLLAAKIASGDSEIDASCSECCALWMSPTRKRGQGVCSIWAMGVMHFGKEKK